jgi:hypothetical protein
MARMNQICGTRLTPPLPAGRLTLPLMGMERVAILPLQGGKGVKKLIF